MPHRWIRPHPLPAAILGTLLILGTVGEATAAGQERTAPSFTLQARRLGGLKAERAALIVSGKQGGGLPAAVVAAPFPAPADGVGAVPFAVEIDGASLLGQRQEEAVRVEIYAYALDASGSVRDFLSQTFRIDAAGHGEAVFEGGVKFLGHLELPAGRYSLRVLAVEPESRSYALRIVPLEVPESGSGTPRLLASLLPEPPDSWVLVREAPREAGEGSSPIAPETAAAALTTDDRGTLPAALPVVGAATEVPLELLGEELGDAPRLAAEITPEAGGSPARTKVELVSGGGTSTGVERLDARLEVPDLPSGRYLLSISAEPGHHTSPVTSPPLPVIVVAQGTQAQMVWSQLRRTATPQVAEGTETEIQLPTRKRKRANAIEDLTRKGYESALRLLGGGSKPGAAAAQLGDLESQLMDQAPDQAVEILKDTELAVILALGKADPESLVPLILLHSQLYLRYRDEHRFQLAIHARTLAATVAELYAKLAGTDGARVVAARALTSLGAYLQEASLWRSSQALLGQALELDPRNEAALLHMAVSFEKVGKYPEAIDPLRKLVHLDTKAPAGRLRLAINLDRVGNEKEAARLFERLIAENNPSWILTIAYEELASVELQEGRLDQAERLLRQGIDRLPGEQRLYIQLAFVLDRQRQPLRAREVLSRLVARGNHGGESPRHLYNRWPSEELQRTRRSLDQGSTVRLAALSGALDRIDRGKGR